MGDCVKVSVDIVIGWSYYTDSRLRTFVHINCSLYNCAGDNTSGKTEVIKVTISKYDCIHWIGIE